MRRQMIAERVWRASDGCSAGSKTGIYRQAKLACQRELAKSAWPKPKIIEMVILGHYAKKRGISRRDLQAK